MDKLTLKWKIFLFLLGFCAILLAMLWLFQTVFLYDTYKFIRAEEIDQAISYVEKNVNNPQLPMILDTLIRDKEIIVTKTHEFVPPQPPARDNRGRPTQETITKAKEFVLEDGTVLSLTFHAIITPVDATVKTLQTQLYLITAAMILMAVVLAVILSRRISKPLENINRSAKQLAKGNYEASFCGKGFLEIKELSDTLNATAKELSKVESLRRELMANVSHDLRTPLSLIYSYAEMMHDFPGEITPEQTQVIMDETKRLASLVDDVLDISRHESGMSALNPSLFNLTAAIGSIVASTAELLRQNGYTVDFMYESEHFVWADESKITQAFYNLLVNAINYCGQDQTIIVTQSVQDNLIKIQVSDHGEGIPPEDLPYIWERYYKSNKNHKRAVMGSGLGLSIVRKILTLHGAVYGVESQVGIGSTFWFTLTENDR